MKQLKYFYESVNGIQTIEKNKDYTIYLIKDFEGTKNKNINDPYWCTKYPSSYIAYSSSCSLIRIKFTSGMKFRMSIPDKEDVLNGKISIAFGGKININSKDKRIRPVEFSIDPNTMSHESIYSGYKGDHYEEVKDEILKLNLDKIKKLIKRIKDKGWTKYNNKYATRIKLTSNKYNTTLNMVQGEEYKNEEYLVSYEGDIDKCLLCIKELYEIYNKGYNVHKKYKVIEREDDLIATNEAYVKSFESFFLNLVDRPRPNWLVENIVFKITNDKDIIKIQNSKLFSNVNKNKDGKVYCKLNEPLKIYYTN